jgi:hypothetical protein
MDGLNKLIPKDPAKRQIFDALVKLSSTRLTPWQEYNYIKFAKENRHQINDPTYDLRGVFKAQQEGMPVFTEINKYDGKKHFSDGYTDPFSGEYISFKRGNNPEKYWEMIPPGMYDDPDVIKTARKYGVY